VVLAHERKNRVLTPRASRAPSPRRQLVVRIERWEQVPISVGGHRQRRMPESRLHRLERQLQPAIDAPIDAPARVEMPQAVQPLILRAPVLIDDARLDLRPPQHRCTST
jgi:hypothetical protein